MNNFRPLPLVAIILGAIAIGTISIYGTNYMAAAGFSYLLFILGLIFRKTRRFHVRLMATGMILDVSLVLILELGRSAIDTALSGKLSLVQHSHIAFSTFAVVFYIPTFIYGLKRLKGSKVPAHRVWHIRMALTAFTFRSLGFVTMFSLLSHVRAV